MSNHAKKDKSVLEAALKLPLKARKRIATKLLESIEDQELQKAVLEGARIAEKRLSDLRRGRSRKVSEEEIEKLLTQRLEE